MPETAQAAATALTIIGTVTFANPRQPAEGIHHAIDNGIPATTDSQSTDSQPTGALAGWALRRTPE